MAKSRLMRLDQLLNPILEGKYRLGPHVAKHMVAEGFTEADLIGALRWGSELAIYPEDQRMLVLGFIAVSPRLQLPMHVILEHRQLPRVDIVTAFLPRDPYKVYSRARVAALLEPDGKNWRWTVPRLAGS